MQMNSLKATFKTAMRGAAVLLLGVGAATAQAQVNLTAAPTTLTLPDGSTVPMWGYSCGTAAGATCAALNPGAGSGWSPVVITVPTGQPLTINLTNNLTFANSNTVPTSLMIVGQVGGGLGDPTQRTTTPSPTHQDLTVTWPTAGAAGSFAPPPQGPRVQSFATERQPH